ncbi:MAG TPA: DNA methyltransferase [Oscillatoriaceae cyanobacterium]
MRQVVRALREELEAQLTPEEARRQGLLKLAERCTLADNLFATPESLGWAYQEWRRNEREQLFAHLRRTRGAKIEGEQTLLATQLYTEPYMVRFLVENALSAICQGPYPPDWSMRLLDGGDRPADTLTVLDPACGTGHLLLGAFDALFQLQRAARPEQSPEAIAHHILSQQLHGLDLDPEAVAIARQALLLRARQLAPALDTHALALNLRSCEALGEAGTLVRLEAESTSAHDPLQRLLAHRYDLILTNPPFLGPKTMGPALRAHLNAHYADTREDVQTAFLDRCRELVRPGGILAAVSMRAWLYQAAFRRFRERVFREDTLLAFADLGAQAFDTGLGLHEGVSVMLTCFRREAPPAEHHALGVRACDPIGPEAKAEAMRAAIADANAPQRHRVHQAALFALPETPFCYGLPKRALSAIASGSSLSGRVKQGLATTNNDRFLRYDWELAPEDHARWVRIARGGTYRKWWGLEQVRVDWADDGAAIKAQILEKYHYLKDWRWVAKNANYYFKPGLTYSYMCYGSLSARVMDEAIFEVASIGVFPEAEDRPLVLAALNARTASWMLRGLSQKHMFQAGMVEKLPMPVVSSEAGAEIAELVAFCVATKRELATFDPLEAVFDPARLDPPLAAICDRQDALAAALHTAEGRLESLVCEGYGLDEAAIAHLTAETGIPVAWHPLLSGRDAPLSTLPAGLSAQLAPHPRCASLPVATPKGESADWGPLPVETPLETVAARLGVHPISAYWLLREQGPDAARLRELAEDVLTVRILELLGHRWAESSASGPGPGLVPLTSGLGMPTLGDRLREKLGSSAIAVLEAALGTPLDDWLATAFFRRHASRFKKRPILWQVASKPPRGRRPVFSCLIYFHALDTSTLKAITALATRLPAGAERDAFLERQRNPAIPTEPQEGVRKALAGWQRAGLLPVDVLAKQHDD